MSDSSGASAFVWTAGLPLGLGAMTMLVTERAFEQTAQSETESWIVKALGLLRFAQCLFLIPVVFWASSYRHPIGVVGGFVLWVVWSVLLIGLGLRRPTVWRWVVAEVLLATVLQPVITISVPGGYTDWQNWTFPPAAGAVLVAVLYLRWPVATFMMMIVLAGFAVSLWYETVTLNDGIFVGALASGGTTIVFFAAVSFVSARTLRGLARQVDSATATAVAAMGREAAVNARFEERTQQYKMLHDTVLHTLSKIARGGLDHRQGDVQQLCERDANYLRSLITSSNDHVPSSLANSLGELVRDRAALGMQIHSRLHRLPAGLPRGVHDAIVNATREALNNVSKYAGVDEAWVTAVGRDDRGVKITIVDRGCGFDLSSPTSGLGLTRSIRHRMEEIHGTVVIDSAIGEGTTVELTWKP